MRAVLTVSVASCYPDFLHFLKPVVHGGDADKFKWEGKLKATERLLEKNWLPWFIYL